MVEERRAGPSSIRSILVSIKFDEIGTLLVFGRLDTFMCSSLKVGFSCSHQMQRPHTLLIPCQSFPLASRTQGEDPLPVEDVKKKLSAIHKKEEKKKDLPQAGLIKEGLVAFFCEKSSNPPSRAQIFFSSRH
jgi:hypothetical protein